MAETPREISVKVSLKHLAPGLIEAAGKMDDLAAAIGQGTYYTDDEFQEAMETAELAGERRGYGRAINDVIVMLSDNYTGIDAMIVQVREMFTDEEG